MGVPDNLLAYYPIVSDQVSREDLRLVLIELEATLNTGIQGTIVEFGCYKGTTSLFIRRLLDLIPNGAGRDFHVYDSFAGLPAKTIADASIAGESFKEGELAVSKRQFVREFRRAGLLLPTIHKGWFEELTDRDVPQPISFAFLDGDFYESMLASLRLVWPRMAKGGKLLIDDYGREALPGVERAVRDYFRSRALPELRVSQDIAILTM
jgi:O-methyltransferase